MNFGFRSYILFAVFLCGSWLFCGCSMIENSHRQKEPMMADWTEGRNDAVLERINRKLDPAAFSSVVGTGDEIMWRLEAGSMNFMLSNYAESVKQFKRAEELIADYDARALVSLRDAAGEGAMAVTNLNALPYRGLCRDRIALSIYKSLAYLGLDNESAFRAQLRRLRDEQKKVQEDYRTFFEAEQKEMEAVRKNNPAAAREADAAGSKEKLEKNPKNKDFSGELEKVKKVAHRGYGNFLNPAAIFLSGLGSIRDGSYENARIDFQRLYEAMPDNPMIQQYYVTVLKEARRPVPAKLEQVKPFDFPLGRNCVYVIFANGRSAAFKQISIYFPVMTAWPMCEFYEPPFRSLEVTADGTKYRTVILADMDGILAQEFHERLPGMVTRIALSTAIKEAGKYAAAFAAGQEDTAIGVGVFLGASIYTAVMNTADTRSWEILPKEFQLTQFPMPEDRTVTLCFEGRGTQPKRLKLPDDCASAIVVVTAPGTNTAAYQILPLKSK